MSLSIAKPGTPPPTGPLPDAWVNISHLAEFDPDPPGYTVPEGDFLARTGAAVSVAGVVSADVLAHLFPASRVRRSADSCVVGAADGNRYYFPHAATRRFTDLEREGEWAKRYVAQRLAAAFPWLDAAQGRGKPEGAYTDDLWKVEVGFDPARDADPWWELRAE